MQTRSVPRFLHASDLRLGQVVRGVGQVPDEVREPLLAAPWRSAAAVFQSAIDHAVDFVLLTGSVLPADAGQGRAVLFLRDWFTQLNALGIRVLWHIPEAARLGRWRDGIDWPENLQFPDEAHGAEIVIRGGEEVTEIICGGPAADPDGFCIEVLDAFPQTASGADYAAVAGTARHDTITGGCTIHCPGATCSLGPDEPGRYGCSLVEVDHNHCVQLTFLRTGTVLRKSLHVTVPDDAACLETLIRTELRAARDDSVDRLRIWTVRLESAGDRSTSLLEAADLRDSLKRLQSDPERSPDHWLADIQLAPTGATMPTQSAEGCLADFLSLLRQQEDSASAHESKLISGTRLPRTALVREMARLGTALLSWKRTDINTQTRTCDMKLRHLQVERFGIWNTMQLEDLGDGLTVLYGPNGSGKTTLMHFVRAVLYGPGSDSSAVHAGQQGGRIGVRYDELDLEICRLWDADGSDAVSVTGPDGAENAVSIDELLGEVSPELFGTLFTVGHREAEELDLVVTEALADGELVEAAEHDVARVNKAITAADAEDGRLESLIATRSRLCEQIEMLAGQETGPPAALMSLAKQIEAAEAEVHALQQQPAVGTRPPEPRRAHGFAGEKIQRLEVRIRQWQNWQQDIDEQLSAIGRELHEASLRDVSGSRRTVVEPGGSVRTMMTAVENQLTLVRSELEGQPSEPVNSASVLHAEINTLQDRIFLLCEMLGQHEIAERLRSLEAESEQLSRCRAEGERQIAIMLEQRRQLQRTCAEGAPQESRHGRRLTTGVCQSAAHRQWLESNHDQTERRAEVRESDGLHLATERLADLLRQRAQLEGSIAEDGAGAKLEELRFDLNVLDEEISGLAEQRDVRRATRKLLEELRAEYESQLQPRVLAEASEYLTRLSGEPFRLTVAEDGHGVSIHHPTVGRPQPLSSLSRGERDQVALSLRLALIRACARRGTSFPLILDDVFVTSDSESAAATALVLRDFAAENQQVLFFTCHQHIADTFRKHEVTVRELPEQRVLPGGVPEEPVVTAPWVMADTTADSLVVKAFRSEIDELTDRTASVGDGDSAENWIFYTELTTPTAELAGLSGTQADELASRGVRTVEDLLAVVPDSASLRLPELSPEQIRSLQAQAVLSCRVPMLRREDAELLVVCGFRTPEKLAAAHPSDVFDVIERFLQTSAGSRFVRSTNPFDRQMAINWVRSAVHARTLWHAREQFDRPTLEGTQQAQAAESLSAGADGMEERGSDETGSTRSPSGFRASRTLLRKRNRGRSSSRSMRSRSARSVHSHSARATTRVDQDHASSEDEGSTASQRALRFHLQRTAPVEAAPSIGPRTAERLAAVEIMTVDDLLAAEPEQAASRLGHRRIKAETLRQWQSQAILVCCVPELRGHDAQILVALEITTPEALAACDPLELFSRVGPFVETSEGERIIRNGRKPDLDEVTYWIDCAKQSRALKAA